MKKLLVFLFVISLMAATGIAGYYWAKQESGEVAFPVPFIPQPSPKPLLDYTIPALSQRVYQPSRITIESEIADEDTYTSYIFSYTTMGKKMTGQLNLPKPVPAEASAIIMVRGYVPLEIYESGVGTRNAARILAENGFITVAPNFFGFGGSDPEFEEGWQARFAKPIQVIELIKTLEAEPIILPSTFTATQRDATVAIENHGLWGHSNGGQIVLTTLEALQQPIPATLWAPVTAPFPYSVLFFSDESQDEGKSMRLWLSQFEADYDVFDFTLTKHLDRLRGPLQLHHGTADEAALQVWSDEFTDKLEIENQRREAVQKAAATNSAEIATPSAFLQPIEYTYYTYPGADHNLQPGWDTVVERDLEFFKQSL